MPVPRGNSTPGGKSDQDKVKRKIKEKGEKRGMRASGQDDGEAGGRATEPRTAAPAPSGPGGHSGGDRTPSRTRRTCFRVPCKSCPILSHLLPPGATAEVAQAQKSRPSGPLCTAERVVGSRRGMPCAAQQPRPPLLLTRQGGAPRSFVLWQD